MTEKNRLANLWMEKRHIIWQRDTFLCAFVWARLLWILIRHSLLDSLVHIILMRSSISFYSSYYAVASSCSKLPLELHQIHNFPSRYSINGCQRLERIHFFLSDIGNDIILRPLRSTFFVEKKYSRIPKRWIVKQPASQPVKQACVMLMCSLQRLRY